MCPGHHSSKTLAQRLPSGPLTETRERNDSLVQAAARAYPTWRWFSSAGFGNCPKCVFEITDLVHQPLLDAFWGGHYLASGYLADLGLVQRTSFRHYDHKVVEDLVDRFLEFCRLSVRRAALGPGHVFESTALVGGEIYADIGQQLF